MNWRKACIWTSWTLVPMAALLVAYGSPLGWLYGIAAVTAFGYHWFDQRRFYTFDHVLAWACIAANCWLAWRTHDWRATTAGALAVGLALVSYYDAHADRQEYDRHHTYWHLWCGLAGRCLARGYVGS